MNFYVTYIDVILYILIYNIYVYLTKFKEKSNQFYELIK